MSAQYPFNTPLTPQEWYCRADNTICVKSWAGLLVVEYAAGAHGRISRLLPKLAALYNQSTIPYIYTDYDAQGNFIAQGIYIYIRLIVQNNAAASDLGAPSVPGSGVAVRQIIFYTLPYRRDVREIIDTV